MGIFYFLIIITILILVHEFGHFIVAKAFNVFVPEFSLGVGRVVYSKTIGETMFNIRLFPFAGFVRLAGESNDDESVPLNRTLKGIHPLNHLLILLSGVLFNALFAWFLIFVVYINSFGNIVDALIGSTDLMLYNIKLIYGALGDVVSGSGASDVTGIVGMVLISEQQSQLGFMNMVYFTAIISLNLAIFNALPLPILDGGRVVITFFETILKRKINPNWMKWIMNINLLLLAILFVYVFWADICRLV